ncbi:hypothetical protein ACJX0J_021112, partial [Zea mays]
KINGSNNSSRKCILCDAISIIHYLTQIQFIHIVGIVICDDDLNHHYQCFFGTVGDALDSKIEVTNIKQRMSYLHYYLTNLYMLIMQIDRQLKILLTGEEK